MTLQLVSEALNKVGVEHVLSSEITIVQFPITVRVGDLDETFAISYVDPKGLTYSMGWAIPSVDRTVFNVKIAIEWWQKWSHKRKRAE